MFQLIVSIRMPTPKLNLISYVIPTGFVYNIEERVCVVVVKERGRLRKKHFGFESLDNLLF